MKSAIIFLFLLVISFNAPAWGFNAAEVEESALQGFKVILQIWRDEDYQGLYARLIHAPGQGWDYFAGRIVYASRRPACCWEQIQQARTTALDQNHAVINARVGFEEEGVGTRTVTREFSLTQSEGVWKLPMGDVLELCRYNLQRIPKKIFEISP